MRIKDDSKRTVRELIEYLKQLPQDMDLRFQVGDDPTFHRIKTIQIQTVNNKSRMEEPHWHSRFVVLKNVV